MVNGPADFSLWTIKMALNPNLTGQGFRQFMLGEMGLTSDFPEKKTNSEWHWR